MSEHDHGHEHGHGKAVLEGLREPGGALREQIPDVYEGFSQLNKAALREGYLDVKTKELIAFAIAVSHATRFSRPNRSDTYPSMWCPSVYTFP